MARNAERPGGPRGYFWGFGLTAFLLTGMTLILVLVVLPRRYVLRAGLRESGVSFPSEAPAFLPPEEQHRQPVPLPTPPPPVPKGPAEIFWSEVQPLLEAERYSAALPLFSQYLDGFPEDRNVLREYGITLDRANRPSEAVAVYRRLLSQEDDPGVRLLLARGLRDLGRLDEASNEYAALVETEPGDSELAREWARALSWGRQYEEAAGILTQVLEREPTAVETRVELAQIYYWWGHLDEADEVLSGLDEEALRRVGAVELRESIVEALTPPEIPEEHVEPTLVQRAEEALVAEDLEGAAAFYRQALSEAPEDTTTWRSYADLLQYRLDDLDGARDALVRVESFGGYSPRLQFRLAQLDAWTGRNEEAVTRLETLLVNVALTAPPETAPDSVGFGPERVAEASALLGDVRRWQGERVEANRAYEEALAADSLSPEANAGMEALEAEVLELIDEEEAGPRLGGTSYLFTDSDEFERLDLAADGVMLDGMWAWSTRAGTRWLGGIDLGGNDDRNGGIFLETELAHWWQVGTLRTGIHFAVEEVRDNRVDLTVGGSIRWGNLAGFRTDVRYDHGPAYPLTVTLQSVAADVVQDRLTATASRQLGDRWSLSAAGDGSWLRARDLSGADGSFRLEGGLSLGRSVGRGITLGVNTRALTYSAPAPTAGGIRLFWDPRSMLSGGVFAQWDWGFGERWKARALVNPSYAYIDERILAGSEGVPHVSGEAGIAFLGSRFQTTLDAFYYQGRMEGYKA